MLACDWNAVKKRKEYINHRDGNICKKSDRCDGKCRANISGLMVSDSCVVCTLKCICVVRAITCIDDGDRKKESGERSKRKIEKRDREKEDIEETTKSDIGLPSPLRSGKYLG